MSKICCKSQLHVTISGSFRRHYEHIVELSRILKNTKKVQVLSPAESYIREASADFIRLESDSINASIKEIEDIHLDAIKQSDFLVVYVPDGKPGYSTLIEIGYAIASEKPIYCIGHIHDEMISQYVTILSAGKDLLNMVDKVVVASHEGNTELAYSIET